jgi:hypothetical protein
MPQRKGRRASLPAPEVLAYVNGLREQLGVEPIAA